MQVLYVVALVYVLLCLTWIAWYRTPPANRLPPEIRAAKQNDKIVYGIIGFTAFVLVVCVLSSVGTIYTLSQMQNET